jgi:NADH-quinone oxidoreductase subunit M
MLTVLLLLPLAAAVIVLLLPAGGERLIKGLTIAVTSAVFVWTLVIVSRFQIGSAALQMIEKAPWIPSVGISYAVGIDGLSLPLVVLTGLLCMLAAIYTWRLDKQVKVFCFLLLLLQVGMLGVFVALDAVLFYVFWELVLVPMYFLISIWGGPRREYASLKFFLYTLFGSVFMLVGIIALFLYSGGRTFDITQLGAVGSALTPLVQSWLFAAFFLGFAVKVPIWPLHTWLPDAHVEAPTAGSVLLAGVLLKMGTYGFIRIAIPLLPAAARAWQPALAILAMISIVYGAAVAFAQTDLKKLVAYSSVSHMGFVMLGIASLTTAGMNGAVAVMFSHGLVTGLLFLMVGMVYERGHTRQIADISGLVTEVPRIGAVFAVASFASLGLPGLSGFVGEFLSLLGAWQSDISRWVVVLSAVGVLLAAAYMLWMVQRVILGEPSRTVSAMKDMTRMEMATVVPLIALSLVVGIWWSSLLRFVDPAVRGLLAVFGGGA